RTSGIGPKSYAIASKSNTHPSAHTIAYLKLRSGGAFDALRSGSGYLNRQKYSANALDTLQEFPVHQLPFALPCRKLIESPPFEMKIFDRCQTRESEERLVTEKPFPCKLVRCELPTTPIPGREASQPLETEGRGRHSFDRIIGRSPAMQRIYRIIE